MSNLKPIICSTCGTNYDDILQGKNSLFLCDECYFDYVDFILEEKEDDEKTSRFFFNGTLVCTVEFLGKKDGKNFFK